MVKALRYMLAKFTNGRTARQQLGRAQKNNLSKDNQESNSNFRDLMSPKEAKRYDPRKGKETRYDIWDKQ